MTAKEEAFVRGVISRATIAALAAMSVKPGGIMRENMRGPLVNGATPDWSSQDSAGCYDEYIALCREAHLRGEPVPAWMQSRGEPIPENMEIVRGAYFKRRAAP